jgi:hypothetical protein
MPHAGIAIRLLITNRCDDGLIEKPKLVHCVAYDSGFNIRGGPKVGIQYIVYSYSIVITVYLFWPILYIQKRVP